MTMYRHARQICRKTEIVNILVLVKPFNATGENLRQIIIEFKLSRNTNQVSWSALLKNKATNVMRLLTDSGAFASQWSQQWSITPAFLCPPQRHIMATVIDWSGYKGKSHTFFWGFAAALSVTSNSCLATTRNEPSSHLPVLDDFVQQSTLQRSGEHEDQYIEHRSSVMQQTQTS